MVVVEVSDAGDRGRLRLETSEAAEEEEVVVVEEEVEVVVEVEEEEEEEEERERSTAAKPSFKPACSLPPGRAMPRWYAAAASSSRPRKWRAAPQRP